ncbi:pre-60S factor rei1 [Blastocladiella emersonii ATCC 22665]|nr:pre-60S factor rei1 [Blastocladiella emersonii ATCC 22665]
MSAAAPAGYAFTCLSCHVAFATAEQQRTHYRTDWHRYNLKRKVAELAPVSAEEFAQRVLSRQAADRSEAENAALGYTCNLCNKTYANENGYKNHIASKKHKDKALAADIDVKEYPTALLTRQPKKAGAAAAPTSGASPATSATPVTSTDAAAAATGDEAGAEPAFATLEELADKKIKNAVKLDLNDCLFCNLKLPTMEDALDHMATAHSFFIPDIDYLVDLPGLLAYLGEKVSVGNACLWCYSPYREGHTDLKTKGLFKDLAAVRKHMCDKGHCKVAYEDGADLELADYYDFSSTWEGVEGDDVDESAAAAAAASGITIDAESNELVLPSGKALGHRDYRRFYRQTIRAPSADEEKAIVQLTDRYKALGIYEMQVRRQEHRSARDFERRRLYHEMGLGTRTNKLQKYFREQVLY